MNITEIYEKDSLKSSLTNAKSEVAWFMLISCVYIVCIVIFFYPCLPSLATHLLGPPADNMQDLWNLWYSQIALNNDPFTFFKTNLIFYPEGASLTHHTLSYSNLFIAFVLLKIVPVAQSINTLVVMQNMMLLMSYYFAAVGCFYLARHYTHDNLSSVLAGFIFAFNPSHFAQSLHSLGVSTIQYLPFFVLFFVRFMENRKWKEFVGVVVFLTLSALSHWYYLVYCMYFLLFYYLFQITRTRMLLFKEVVKPVTMILLATFILLSPLIVPMLSVSLGNKNTELPGHNFYVADLLSFIVFHPYHLLSNLSLKVNMQFSGNPWEMTAYLGMVNIGLVFWWLINKQKKTPINGLSYQLYGMLFFMLFAGGAFLHILGNATFIPLPTLVTQFIPLFKNVRTPTRAIVFSYLFLSIIVAIITTKYMTIINRKKGIGFFSILSLFIFIDYYPTGHDVTKVEAPNAYNVIFQDPDASVFGILDLPYGYEQRNRYMMYQLFHGKPLVTASISRKLNPTLLDRLDIHNLSVQEKQLLASKVKYLIIHRKFNDEVSQDERLVIENYEKMYHVVYSDDSETVMKIY